MLDPVCIPCSAVIKKAMIDDETEAETETNYCETETKNVDSKPRWSDETLT